MRVSILTQLSWPQHLNTHSATNNIQHSSLTMILSESMTVSRRWAMVSTVWSQNSSRMMLWMMASVLTWEWDIEPHVQRHTHSRSTLAVASSSTRMWFLFKRALPRQNSCLWPTLKLAPPSLTAASSFPSRPSTTPLSWTYNNTKCSNVMCLELNLF